MSATAQTSDFASSSPKHSGLDRQRGFDCRLALIALICLAPLLAAIATAIWIESGGPVFFSQTRLGKRARRFRRHKFRKFHMRNQQAGPAVTLRDDPRMTRVGRMLERTKLDELPQLWNIVVGEMALVGPRPESLAFADCFAGAYHGVLDHRPGIFGPCQTVFRYESLLYAPGCDPEAFYRSTLFPLKAQLDLTYFSNRNPISDAGWAVRCVLAVFGWSLLPGESMRRLEAVERWVQQFTQMAV